MKRIAAHILVLSILWLTAVCTYADQAPASQSAQALYQQALAEQAAGNPKQAIQTAARLLAEYWLDETWAPRAELLCATLYIQLDMFDEADVTARQIQKLYDGTDTAKLAARLRLEIQKIREKKEMEGSTQ